MTIGEYKVGLDFNPSGDPKVTALKQAAASFIDLCQKEMVATNSEVCRLLSLAMTHAEDAAMWAVKAVTKKPYA